jgi:hypothetical protein
VCARNLARNRKKNGHTTPLDPARSFRDDPARSFRDDPARSFRDDPARSFRDVKPPAQRCRLFEQLGGSGIVTDVRPAARCATA